MSNIRISSVIPVIYPPGMLRSFEHLCITILGLSFFRCIFRELLLVFICFQSSSKNRLVGDTCQIQSLLGPTFGKKSKGAIQFLVIISFLSKYLSSFFGYSFVHSLDSVYLIILIFVRLFGYPFVSLSVHLFILLFGYSGVQLFGDLFIRLFGYPFVRLFRYPVANQAIRLIEISAGFLSSATSGKCKMVF